MISVLLALALSNSYAAQNEKPLEVCWGNPGSRCYSIGGGEVSDSIKGMKAGRRSLDAKAEISVRKAVDEFKAWATSKKATLSPAKLAICKDVLTIRSNGAPTFICLNSVSKKEMKPKETALLEALRGAKR